MVSFNEELLSQRAKSQIFLTVCRLFFVCSKAKDTKVQVSAFLQLSFQNKQSN